MKTIESKLNQNPIGDLTEEEWNIIYQNVELRTLFLQRVKEHIPFNTGYLTEEVIKLLFQPENIENFLECFKISQNVEYLTSIGCEAIQGYYFSKPIPYKEFKEKYYK